MIVKELINELLKCDPNSKVIVYGNYNDLFGVIVLKDGRVSLYEKPEEVHEGF
jgi:hypothetical protein